MTVCVDGPRLGGCSAAEDELHGKCAGHWALEAAAEPGAR